MLLVLQRTNLPVAVRARLRKAPQVSVHPVLVSMVRKFDNREFRDVFFSEHVHNNFSFQFLFLFPPWFICNIVHQVRGQVNAQCNFQQFIHLLDRVYHYFRPLVYQLAMHKERFCVGSCRAACNAFPRARKGARCIGAERLFGRQF